MIIRSPGGQVVAQLCRMSLTRRQGAGSDLRTRLGGALDVAARGAVLGFVLVGAATLGGCGDGSDGGDPGVDRGGQERSSKEALSLDVLVVEEDGESTSAEGLAYVQRLAAAARAADELGADAKPQALLNVLLPAGRETPPAHDPLAHRARLELLARAGEILLEAQRGDEVVALLQPVVGAKRSLPLEAVTAQLLVQLGDGAIQCQDTDLAIASYTRSVRLMGLLRKKMELELGLDEVGDSRPDRGGER